MRILLIAGHGDGDPGACSQGYEEANLTREFANLLKNAFASYNCEVDIAPTQRNYYEYLQSNNFDFSKYGYVFEIHFNAGGGTGCEVFVPPNTTGITVEQALIQNLATAAEFKNRGVKTGNFYVIKKIKRTGVDAALLEVCFIDSKSDMQAYSAKKTQMAQAVAKGICDGFGIKQNQQQPVAPKKEEEEEMTQEKFNEMMNNWIAASAQLPPADWSQEARNWAENNGLIKGDDNGNMSYQKFMTREELAVVLQRALKGKI